MTMKRYQALHEFWADNPPADLLIAAYFKVGRFAKNNKRKSTSKGLPKYDHQGKPLPPTLDESPSTMKDLFDKLKRSGQKSLTLNDIG